MDTVELRNGLWAKVRKAVYWIVLPTMTASALLIVSGMLDRPRFMGSAVIDFASRLYLTLLYCWAFVLFSDKQRFERWVMGGREPDAMSNASALSRIGGTAMVVMLFGFMAIITQWTIRTFLPDLSRVATCVAAGVGALMTFPEMLRRWQWKDRRCKH